MEALFKYLSIEGSLLQAPERAHGRCEAWLSGSGFVTEISQRWAKECRRQHAPASTKKIGKQGALPQRAPKRRAGENHTVLEVEPEGEAASGEREGIAPEDLCSFLLV